MGVYNGKFWKLPAMTNVIFLFLTCDMSENTTKTLDNVSNRGMKLLYKAYSLDNSTLCLTDETSKNKNETSIWRDVTILLFAICIFYKYYLSAFCIWQNILQNSTYFQKLGDDK